MAPFTDRSGVAQPLHPQLRLKQQLFRLAAVTGTEEKYLVSDYGGSRLLSAEKLLSRKRLHLVLIVTFIGPCFEDNGRYRSRA
jgi:hypothetical protein